MGKRRNRKIKKPKHMLITGEKWLGMSYSYMEVEIGKRDWYQKVQEKLIRYIEGCKP